MLNSASDDLCDKNDVLRLAAVTSSCCAAWLSNSVFRSTPQRLLLLLLGCRRPQQIGPLLLPPLPGDFPYPPRRPLLPLPPLPDDDPFFPPTGQASSRPPAKLLLVPLRYQLLPPLLNPARVGRLHWPPALPRAFQKAVTPAPGSEQQSEIFETCRLCAKHLLSPGQVCPTHSSTARKREESPRAARSTLFFPLISQKRRACCRKISLMSRISSSSCSTRSLRSPSSSSAPSWRRLRASSSSRRAAPPPPAPETTRSASFEQRKGTRARASEKASQARRGGETRETHGGMSATSSNGGYPSPH